MKTAEYAPGLPDRDSRHDVPTVKHPTVWEFALQKHDAERAGPHLDLRLGDPETGHAHSWAMRYWPKPGETRLAIAQPTHTVSYMDFKGEIKSGYGAGKVDLARRDKTEIVSASKGHVRFNLYGGRTTEEYLLRNTDKGWMLKNITVTRDQGPGMQLPASKPKYREVRPDKLDAGKPDTIWQAKIDGAHVVYQFPDTGRTPNVFSYRPTERVSGVIEHTHRVPGLLEQRTPGALKDSVFRGELSAVGPDGKALPASQVGGLLNAGVWKSREKQKAEGQLVPVVFDVVRFRGEDVEHAPYERKLELLRKAVEKAPWLQLPRTAETPEEKRRLLEDVREGREPSTIEGLIEWRRGQPTPTKAKFKADQDVYVREPFAEASARGMAGGFTYSSTPNGPVVGRVGTGLSHQLKRDLMNQPERYRGLKARIEAQRGPQQHAHRSPSFLGWHLDQPLPENIKAAAAHHDWLAGVRDDAKKRGYNVFAVVEDPKAKDGASVTVGASPGNAVHHARKSHERWERKNGIDPKHDWAKTAEGQVVGQFSVRGRPARPVAPVGVLQPAPMSRPVAPLAARMAPEEMHPQWGVRAKMQQAVVDRYGSLESQTKPVSMDSWGFAKQAMVLRHQQETQQTCSAACLKAVLHHWGTDIEESKLAELIGVAKNGAETFQIVDAARRLGFKAYEKSFKSLEEVKSLTDHGVPIICDVQSFRYKNRGHYVVLESVDDDGVHLMDPNVDGNVRLITPEDMNGRWWDREMKHPHRPMVRWGVVVEPRC